MKKAYVLLAIGALVILLVSWVYLPTLSRYRELKTEQERIEQKIETLDAEIRKLEQERNLLKHDRDYLEKVIREELGLVKPGEVVYKFIPENLKSNTGQKPAPGADLSLAESVRPEPPGADLDAEPEAA